MRMHAPPLQSNAGDICMKPVATHTLYRVQEVQLDSIASWDHGKDILCRLWPPGHMHVHANVNENNILAMSEQDFDNSGEPGPQAKGVNHVETPHRQLHAAHRASSCAQQGGHMHWCSKPRERVESNRRPSD